MKLFLCAFLLASAIASPLKLHKKQAPHRVPKKINRVPGKITATTPPLTSTSVAIASASSAGSSAATMSSSTPSPTRPKRGLGYNNQSYLLPFGNKISWAYNWDQTANGKYTLPNNVEYIPMMWGSGSAPNWSKNANAAIAAGATHLLGFNEPDHQQQAKMTPAEAVAVWKANIQPFKGRAKLVSPAVTNGPDPMGIAWLKNFLSLCTDCTVDVIALHWYDSATNIAYFKNYLTDAAAAFPGKKIWLTEFMGSGTVPEQQAFLRTVLPWLDAQPFIERYAAFGAFAGTFIDGSGNIMPLGETYRDT